MRNISPSYKARHSRILIGRDRSETAHATGVEHAKSLLCPTRNKCETLSPAPTRRAALSLPTRGDRIHKTARRMTRPGGDRGAIRRTRRGRLSRRYVPSTSSTSTRQNGPRTVGHGGRGGYAANWFIVLWTPPAFSAASPAKYSLWSSPMSLPDMFWCFTQAMPSRISRRCTPLT